MALHERSPDSAVQTQDSANDHWHHHPADTVLETLETARQDGLDSGEAAARLEQYGRNALPNREPPTLLGVIAHQFKSPLIYILIAAGEIGRAHV